MRQVRQRANIRAAVVAVMLKQFFGFKVPAELGFDFRAREHRLDVRSERRARALW